MSVCLLIVCSFECFLPSLPLKRPDKKHVIDLLARNAHEYERFAIALDVDRGFVKGLSGYDNVVKLDEIIGKWMTTRSTPIT